MKESPARTLVFDLDGTLVESAVDLMEARNLGFAGEGIAPAPVEAARRLLGKGGRALIKRGFALAERTLDDEKLEILFAKFLAHYNAHIADHTVFYPGVVAFLDRCRALGWPLAVCTNKLEASSKLLLGKLGALDRFGFVCGQDTFGVGKPDPRPLVETIRAVGGEVSRAVMIGDSSTDIETARAAGVPIVCVDFGYSDPPVASFGPDRLISHFGALYEAIESLPVAVDAPSP